ncbi:MAG: helix-turn-helix transcriptional regulator [Burkholderiales bacterium]|nr:helix-turn-helix transcriptional regulator [Burkholderiales bacterium]
MNDMPNIAGVAALIGERARAAVLSTLLVDRVQTATELASVAGVTKQTVSSHLAKLVDGGLVAVDCQGRNRYFRLADQDVAQLLASLTGVAMRTGAVGGHAREGDQALSKARVCYGHLAGEMAVVAYEGLLKKRVFDVSEAGLTLTRKGEAWFYNIGVDVDQARRQRRALCCACRDWGERQHHLGGALGTALLDGLLARKWARRTRDSRVVSFTPSGEQAFVKLWR